MLKLHKPLHNQRGISVVELVIGAFILALISAVTLQAFLSQKEASNMQAQVSDAQQAATFSLAEITKQVRNAGYRVPTGTPPYRINVGTLGHDTLIIYFNNGAGIDSTRFFLDHTGVYSDAAHPSLVKRTNTAAPEIYAENIENIDFFPGTKSLTVSLTARTEDIDKHLNDYRRRTVSTNIMIPNAP
jgi:type II secretory pathway pseudopilin PulG